MAHGFLRIVSHARQKKEKHEANERNAAKSLRDIS
nr:MAG TPA: hypothetical protein [Bacteriophage sp.]